MALFTIADLHLSLSADKPMDIFGAAWFNHTERLENLWRGNIGEDDTVVIPGDISWGMKLDGAAEDLRFIDALPGKKIIGKGNHDYWWGTLSKLNRFKEELGISSIEFLFNNAFRVDGKIVCGTRGWFPDNGYTAEDEKIVLREAGRLRLSLEAGIKLREKEESSGVKDEEIIVFLHYPPAYSSTVCAPLVSILSEYGIKRCFYGHIHGANADFLIKDVGRCGLELISADYLGFMPKKVI